MMSPDAEAEAETAAPGAAAAGSGSPSDSAAGAGNPSSNGSGSSKRRGSKIASAPIQVLSKLALKDAIVELEANVRRQSDVCGSALLQMWQQAEKRLGMEVDIDDPALRGLFMLHVLKVEELCSRVRAQAEATLAAVEMWSQGQLGATAANLRLFSNADGSLDSTVEAVQAEVDDADRLQAAARSLLVSRVQDEVLGAIDERCREHDLVREEFRERARLQSSASSARRDLAWLRKGAVGASGLKSLSGRGSEGPMQEAEVRLTEASLRVAAHDERLLERLRRLSQNSVEVARRPWAALTQIQAEFFTAQQAIYKSLAPPFEEFAAGAEASAAASASPGAAALARAEARSPFS